MTYDKRDTITKIDFESWVMVDNIIRHNWRWNIFCNERKYAVFIEWYNESLIKLELDTFKVKVNFDDFENGTIEFGVLKYIKAK